MITFQVPDMSCGHCVQAITEAVKAADPAAKVDVDLAAKRVAIEPAAGASEDFQRAIVAAGFTPQLA